MAKDELATKRRREVDPAGGEGDASGGSDATADAPGAGRRKQRVAGAAPGANPTTTQLGDLLLGGGLLAGSAGDGEDLPMDDDEAQELQAVVTKMLQKRADKARRKQEQRLAALEERVRAQLRELEMHAARDTQEVRAAAASMLSALKGKLQAKAKAMHDLEARFKSELSKQWAEYDEVYSSGLMQVEEQARRIITRKAAGHRKSLDAVATAAAGEAAALEQEFARTRGRMSQLPEMAALLKSYL